MRKFGLGVAIVSLVACFPDTPEFRTPASSASSGIPPVEHAASKPNDNPLASEPRSMSNLEIIDDVVGTGQEAKSGNKVHVHYTGTLVDGSKFDSSRDRGKPFAFTLGVGQVIKGWDQGVKGMKEGGKRRLVIPPDMGYGAAGMPPVIPPSAVLKFDVELVRVDQ